MPSRCHMTEHFHGAASSLQKPPRLRWERGAGVACVLRRESLPWMVGRGRIQRFPKLSPRLPSFCKILQECVTSWEPQVSRKGNVLRCLPSLSAFFKNLKFYASLSFLYVCCYFYVCCFLRARIFINHRETQREGNCDSHFPDYSPNSCREFVS